MMIMLCGNNGSESKDDNDVMSCFHQQQQILEMLLCPITAVIER